MQSQPMKVVAVRFQQAALTPPLQQLEELYSYGVLLQLNRLGEFQYRDLATLSDKVALDPNASIPELQQCRQICQSTRSQALFTGAIRSGSKEGKPSPELHINFRLFESASNRYVVDEWVRLLSPPATMMEEMGLPISVEDLNRLINQTVMQCLKALLKDTVLPQMEWTPLSHSLPALQALLKAHKTSIVLEKITLYEQALREDPSLETAYTHLAKIYKSETDYEKSVVCYREALKISHSTTRNKAVYATEGGIACALLGKTELALQWWLRAIEYDPSFINPYFNIANTYEDLEDYTLAEKYFLQAQRLAPDDFRTFFNLARIYSKLGYWEKALSQYRYQLQSENDDPWCHSDMATCYLNLGDIPNAKQHLEKTVSLDPEGEAGQYAQLILAGFQ